MTQPHPDISGLAVILIKRDPLTPPSPPAWNGSEEQQTAFAQLIAWLDQRERLRMAAEWAPLCGREKQRRRQS